MEKSTIIDENTQDNRSRRSFVWTNWEINGIGCFIEDFIEQAHQFGILDRKRTNEMRDIKRALLNH